MSRKTQKNPVSRPQRLLIAVLVAGVLSVLGAGSYVTWTALASDPKSPETKRFTPTVPTVDIDSLYIAKANEAEQIDTTARVELQPTRMLSGRISWYGPGFHGRRTASGERFDKHEMTAAHKTLPFGTLVRVTDRATGRSVLVRVNDRGPYSGGRILDLSEAAAGRLGIKGRGTARTQAAIYSLPKNGETISFDGNGHAYTLNGYSVSLLENSSYDQAFALQHQLLESGRQDVFVTLDREDGKVRYRVTVGLFATENLCGTLLAELAPNFPVAGVTEYSIETRVGTSVATATTPNAGESDL